MDTKNPYAMSKLGLEARDAQERPERDCGFYAKYFFLFLSLIQFLIILGLVLFMVYGNPQAGHEKPLQGLSNLLQRAEGKAEALGKEVGELKRRLNASQTETAVARKQASFLNATLRGCVAEKAKVLEQQRIAMMYSQLWQECYYHLNLLNTTCPVKLASLENQLKVLQLQARLDQDKSVSESKLLRDKAEASEVAAKACQVETLQVRTREERYRALESKVVAELGPVQQKLEAAVHQALAPNQLRGCYHSEIAAMQGVCSSLGGNLRGHLDALARKVEQTVKDVAAENGRLEGQKEACAYQLQERERRAEAQRQQAEQEKQELRETRAREALAAQAERSKLAKEKEDLQVQLEQSKQTCLRSRAAGLNPNCLGRPPTSVGSTNPFASFPGGSPNLNPAPPNAFAPPPLWPRPGSLPEQPRRLPDPKMLAPDAAARIPNQPPVGHPSG